MDKPRIRVDFNELIEKDLVLLSKSSSVKDSAGNAINLLPNLPVAIYEHNHYGNDEQEYLLADGVAIPNTFQENPVAKWCCRIDKRGIRVVTNI